MNRFPILVLCLAVLSLGVFSSGCRKGQPAASSSASSGAPFKTYKLRGKVVSIDAARSEVTLDHEAIPGFMSAMTMPYKLKDPTILSEFHPGDTITADILVSDQDVLLDHVVIVGQAKPDYKPAAMYHIPKPGDEVPDFKFLNQSNRQIHLAEFHGKALLVTFIYTRCPLADFCPRMSRNFATIDKALAGDQALYAKTHLLSVSFDPDYDTPQVLRSYGGAYTGKYTNETFSHWDFAAPAKAEQPEITKFFDVGVAPEANKTITHSLSTVLIGPDGKVAQWYPGNDWKPEDVIKDIRQSLQAHS
ncbi:MAG TPA: SCO family protein [Acidisarcina sp.]|nr:SCO family protein [Acidisarcina sp.]